MDNLVSNTRQEAHLNLYRTKREFYNEHTGQKLSKLIENKNRRKKYFLATLGLQFLL